MINKYACSFVDGAPEPSSNTPPDFWKVVEPFRFCDNYLGSIVTAGYAHSEFFIKLNTSLPEAHQLKLAEEFFNNALEKRESQSFTGVRANRFNKFTRPSQIIVPLNLNSSWNSQREKILQVFREHQKTNKFLSIFGIAKQGFESYPLYLRILDALHANASDREIIKYIYGEKGKMSDELRSRKSRNKKAALRIRDYGFRQIPHMTSTKQYLRKKNENLNYKLSKLSE